MKHTSSTITGREYRRHGHYVTSVKVAYTIPATIAIPVLLIVTGVVLWALFAIVVPMFA